MPNTIMIDKDNNVKQTLGFFSMVIAWTAANIIHAIYYGLKEGKATDIEVMIFWSGLFMFIAWAVFVSYPLYKLDNSKPYFKPKFFPFIMTIYAGLSFVIIAVGIFQSQYILVRFTPIALIIGFIFGLTYSTLIQSNSLIVLLDKKPLLKVFSPLSPFFILTFFLWLLPTLFPLAVYRFMPNVIQNKIFAQTILKYKVGDSFSDLQRAFPFDFKSDGQNFSGTYNGPILDYAMVVTNDTITKLDITLRR